MARLLDREDAATGDSPTGGNGIPAVQATLSAFGGQAPEAGRARGAQWQAPWPVSVNGVLGSATNDQS
jgi:hypothetical protein